MSGDGNHIIAKWKVSVAFSGCDIGDVLNFVVYPDESTAFRMAELTPEERGRQAPRISMRAIVAFPDRTYWQLVRDVPVSWLHYRNPHFTHPDAEVDPANPRGMIAAIDELMVRHHPERYGMGDWLHMIRGYYSSMDDRMKKPRAG